MLRTFGQAIENAFGSRPYTIFYLVCGVAANMAQYFVDPSSTVPNLGASGAIAGVMGAYLALYPTSTIDLFVWPLSLFIWRDIRVPAWLMLGVWFAVQVISGVSGLNGPSAASGVAFWAHIGGFLTGLLLALLVRPGQRRALSAG
jgi:membrane associated rhomboid family serine protease